MRIVLQIAQGLFVLVGPRDRAAFLPAPNGTAVCKCFVDMGLGFLQFGSQLVAWPLHERIAMSAAFEDTRLDAAGPVRHLVGGDAGQHHRVHRTRVTA